MKAYKRFLSLLLAVVMCVSLLPSAALAEDEETVEPEDEMSATIPDEETPIEDSNSQDDIYESGEEMLPECSEEIVITILQQPCDATIIEGVAEFSVVASINSEDNLLYQWQRCALYDSEAAFYWENIDGADSNTYTVNANENDFECIDFSYRCMLSCCGVFCYSDEVKVNYDDQENDKSYSPFVSSVKIENTSDIFVTVSADAGIVPDGAILEARRIESIVVDNAIEDVRSEEKNIAISYTFDIKLLFEGKEIEPDGPVNVVFSLAEDMPEIVSVDVYHIDDDTNQVVEIFEESNNSVEVDSENLPESTAVETEIAIVSEKGFSYYVVEFTYKELQYILDGDTSVSLSVILDSLGILGEVLSASSDAPELFDVEDGQVIAKQAFNSEQILSVTMTDGCKYYIKVTDTASGVYTKLLSLKTRYPDGKYWNHIVPASESGQNQCYNESYALSSIPYTDHPCTHHKSEAVTGDYDCNYFDGGIQCCGFAKAVFYDLFGERESSDNLIRKYDNIADNISIGDYVCVYNSSHYAIVLSKSSTSFTVVECNLNGSCADSSQYSCQIRWGASINYSDVVYYVHSNNYDNVNNSTNAYESQQLDSSTSVNCYFKIITGKTSGKNPVVHTAPDGSATKQSISVNTVIHVCERGYSDAGNLWYKIDSPSQYSGMYIWCDYVAAYTPQSNLELIEQSVTSSTALVKVKQTVSGASLNDTTECGIRLYDMGWSLISSKSEAASSVTGYDYRIIWYDIGSGLEINYQLSPNTLYFYEIYTIIGGSESAYTGSFTTNPDSTSSDTVAPTFTWNRIEGRTDSYYRISCLVSDNVGVTKVQFPTWSTSNQSDLIWPSGTYNGDGIWYYDVNLNDFVNPSTVITHIYAWDAAGNSKNISVDSELPKIKNLYICNKTDSGFRVVCSASDNVGVSQVKFPTWSTSNQSDLKWYVGHCVGNGDWYYDINYSDFINPDSIKIHVYVYDGTQNYTWGNIEPNNPTISNIYMCERSNEGFRIACTPSDDTGISSVWYYSWSVPSDCVWCEGYTNGYGTWFYDIKYSDYTDPSSIVTHIFAYDVFQNYSSYAAIDTTFSGQCGNNIIWTLQSNGELRIQGNGSIYDYSVEEAPWYQFKKLITTVVIENGVTSIGSYAFYNCNNLVSVTLPTSVTSIGSSAFECCNSLTSISIPSSVSNIESRAFSNCSNLSSIIVDSDNTYYCSVNNALFSKDCKTLLCCPSGLTAFDIPTNVVNIGDFAFHSSHITYVCIPINVTCISDSSFYGCSDLTDVYYEGTQLDWETINAESLFSTSLPEVNIHFTSGSYGTHNGVWIFEDGILKINGTGAMPSWSSSSDTPWSAHIADIKSVIIGSGITSVGDNAFAGCTGLNSIVLPDGLTAIGAHAFANSGISSITIPSTVLTLGVSAFADCSGLEKLMFKGDVPEFGSSCFSGVSACIYTESIYADSWSSIDPTTIGANILIRTYSGDIFLYTDGSFNRTSSIKVDYYSKPNVQLTAKNSEGAEIADVTWSSDNSDVAVVDAAGLVSFNTVGSVTITGTAADISAAITFDVYYIDESENFTGTIDVAKSGLRVNSTAQISVFGTDKGSSLSADLFEYSITTSGGEEYAEVNELGVVTALYAGKVITVKAALKGDPLNRFATVKFTTVPSASKTISILPNESDETKLASFREIDANGNLCSESGLTADTYALYLDVIPAKGAKETYSVKLVGADEYGEPIVFATGQFKWASTNSKLASVTEDKASGTVTITIMPGVDGAASITATNVSDKSLEASFAVHVMDKSPRLESTKLTLDSQKAGEVVLPLVASYYNKITAVEFCDSGYDSATKVYETASSSLSAVYDAEDETVTLKALSLLTVKSIKGQLHVYTENGTEYRYNLAVTVKNSSPSVAVKQTKLNLFYTNSSSTVTVSVKGETVKSIGLESDVFEATDNSNGTLTVSFIDGKACAKPVTTAYLKLELEGYAYPVSKKISISTETKKPSLKLAPASGTLNTSQSMIANTEVIGLAETLGSGAVTVDSGINFAEASNDDNTVSITLKQVDGAYVGGTVKLIVKDLNWQSPITLSYKLSVTNSVPTVKFGSAKLVLNKAFSDVSAETAFTVSQDNIEIKRLSANITSAPKTADLTAAKGWFSFSVSDGILTVSIKDSSAVADGAYTASIIPITAGNVALAPVSLKFNVSGSIPAVTASNVTLNKNLSENGVSTLKLSSGYTICGIENLDISDDLALAFDAETQSLIVKLTESAKVKTDKSFTVSLKPVVTADGSAVQQIGNAFTLKVTMTDKAPSVSLSVSGKLDTINRSAGVIYSVTKLSNATGKIVSAELSEGMDAELFTLSSAGTDAKGQPCFRLKLNSDAQVSTKVTYKLQLAFTLDSGDVVKTIVSVKPTQSKAALTASPAAMNIYQSQSRNRAIEYRVKVSSPAGAEISKASVGDVKLWQRALADNVKNISVSLDGDTAVVRVTLKDTAVLAAGKTYILPITVTLKGSATDSAATATIKLSLKVIK